MQNVILIEYRRDLTEHPHSDHGHIKLDLLAPSD